MHLVSDLLNMFTGLVELIISSPFWLLMSLESLYCIL